MEIHHPRYVAHAVLGRGAEGVVVRVTDREAPERALVAKIARHEVPRERLVGEFALLSRLRAPGLVEAHDLAWDTETGAPFLVESFVDGPDATAWLAAARDVAERSARLERLLAAVARALAALHEAGFTHGDLKPAHVRVDARPRVLDLGAALSFGFSAAYAAPEQIVSGRATPASDLYGLGATAFAAVVGRPPRAGEGLRSVAPWVPPSLADVVDRARASNPLDRFPSAEALLGALRPSDPDAAVGTTLVGRRDELARLAGHRAGVLYLTGPSGTGKSHLAREVAVHAIAAGRSVRVATAMDVDPRWLAFLRGTGPSPFADPPDLLVIDDVDRAGPELGQAVEAFRCRGGRTPALVVVGATAPEGAPTLVLGPLADDELDELARRVGASHDTARASAGSPGWLLAAAGRGVLGRDAVLARLESLAEVTRDRLAHVALLGGRVLDEGREPADLFSSGVVDRVVLDGVRYVALSSPRLWTEVGRALATPARVAAAVDAARADPATPSAVLALLAELSPEEAATELLREAATRARRDEAREVELAALTTLAERRVATATDLRRLERLGRDLARSDLHARTLGWLREAEDPTLATLARVREAEREGRQGAFDAADEGLAAARSEAEGRRDAAAVAFCEATRGAVALYRADWETAHRALADARARLSALGTEVEELARVDHNLGVVAIYRGDHEAAAAAFERALATKRALGDLPGVRASLLNLGLSATRLCDFARARAALTEALALARSLGERTGRVWTSAALAELAIREGDPRDAERHVAEAEAGGDAVPPAIAADLALLRAEVALLDGDPRRARAALDALDPALRADDALVDGRALALAGRAHLAGLPPDRRAAARAAIAAVRRARRAGLPEVEQQGLAVLADARARAGHTAQVVRSDPDSELWRAVGLLPTARDESARAAIVARCVALTSGAERAFVVVTGDGPLRAHGVDADGFELPAATERVPRDALEGALAADGPLTHRGPPSRVAIATPARGGARVVVVAEHRYVADALAGLAEATVERWAALAAFVPGPATSPVVRLPAPPVEARAESTVVPALAPTRTFPTIVGQSPSLLRALAKLEAALDAPAELPVLIVGETGVGKELFARALHDEGPSAARGAPFVALNCAAVPDALFEAELFGHVRGSFTGADRARGGLAARARGGTLFLDEIGELPLPRQAALLRVLESRRYRPVGSDEELPLEARVVTATNVDLARAVDAGTFRRDLLYRLDVITLRVPPLRERGDDIARLARHFLRATGSKSELAPATVAALEAHAWPGNVRELAHLVQRLSTLGVRRIEPSHLPRGLRDTPRSGSVPAPPSERDEVESALAACDGNITRAAERLGLTRQGLKKRMVRLGVRTAREGSSS